MSDAAQDRPHERVPDQAPDGDDSVGVALRCRRGPFVNLHNGGASDG